MKEGRKPRAVTMSYGVKIVMLTLIMDGINLSFKIAQVNTMLTMAGMRLRLSSMLMNKVMEKV